MQIELNCVQTVYFKKYYLMIKIVYNIITNYYIIYQVYSIIQLAVISVTEHWTIFEMITEMTVHYSIYRVRLDNSMLSYQLVKLERYRDLKPTS